jgi:hypothetical protein
MKMKEIHGLDGRWESNQGCAIFQIMPAPCQTCHKSKAKLKCGIGHEDVCKSCAQFLEEDSFSFFAVVPENLRHSVYCPTCFDLHVAQAQRDYQELMGRARETLVYYKTQSKETRLIRRTEETVSVLDCQDHDELILRLAFFAAQAGFNSIIDVQVHSKKVKLNGYQTTVWSGSGLPANVKEKYLVKDRSIWQNPN